MSVSVLKKEMKSIVKKIISYLSKFIEPSEIVKNKRLFKAGYDDYLQLGKTNQEAYMSMIKLYCQTNGQFNNDKHEEIIRSSSPNYSDCVNGLLGQLTNADLVDINEELIEEGYVKFDNKLSDDVCKRILKFAETTPAIISKSSERVIYNREDLASEVYRFDSQDLIQLDEIQKLIMDPTLIEIARRYLKCEPIFDFPTMWWSTTFMKEASSEAAQMYHFDMDRIKWLKIFFYINEVTEDNGPHHYISGTHKIGSKPQHLLDKGYVRIEDEELQALYPNDKMKCITGKEGSIFAGDTMCWHKGSQLVEGERLVLEFEYCSSLFGANSDPFFLDPDDASPEFIDFISTNKTYALKINIL